MLRFTTSGVFHIIGWFFVWTEQKEEESNHRMKRRWRKRMKRGRIITNCSVRRIRG